MRTSRREFIELSAALGATLAWAGPASAASSRWREARKCFPQGVASGEPDDKSVILWTRRPFDNGTSHTLDLEVAEDASFRRVVARATAPVSAESDWTARALVAGLMPSRFYWYRFTDADGNGSRVGRTRTAPAPNDPRPVNFAFVSCQDVNEGTLNAYRRMIFEDERAAPADQLEFVLHLGDFIYEVVEYPEEAKTRYDRTIYEVARIPDGRKVGKFHIPLTVEGYRAVYKGYLADPDLQDARARWPLVCIWDNHEFSWMGRQSVVKNPAWEIPGQSVKVAANQAWFEYIPARVTAPSGSLDRFGPPMVENVKIETWDDNGLGIEPNNLIAINSLRPTAPSASALTSTSSSPTSAAIAARTRSAIPRSASSAARNSSTCSPSARCGCSTAAGRSTAGTRRRKSASATSTSPIRKGTPRRKPSSAPSRRRGSRTSCAALGPPGKSGPARKARSTSGPIRRTCRRA